MPNVQRMLYSFVRLYLFKCDACVLNYIWIKPKRFLTFLYVFESDCYHSFCSCFVLTLFFIVFKYVLCWKTSVRVFRDSRKSSRLILQLANHETGKMHFSQLTRDSWKSSRLISRLASHEIRKSQVHLEAFATHSWLAKIFATRLVAKHPKTAF